MSASDLAADAVALADRVADLRLDRVGEPAVTRDIEALAVLARACGAQTGQSAALAGLARAIARALELLAAQQLPADFALVLLASSARTLALGSAGRLETTAVEAARYELEMLFPTAAQPSQPAFVPLTALKRRLP